MTVPRFRALLATAAVAVATCALFAPSALGDAGNPVLGTIHGTLQGVLELFGNQHRSVLPRPFPLRPPDQ